MVALYTKSPHESRISLSSLIYVRYIRRKKIIFQNKVIDLITTREKIMSVELNVYFDIVYLHLQ
ncbi:hypothetical protein C0J52_09533 [Blattella germanica]|nr:hypothetical protein C0J52_09533 [Blattella germanica]